MKIDTLVRIRSVQIWCDGQEETALAVYWVTDGIDRCRVGFLPRHLLKHQAAYNGKLAQIVEFIAESNSPADRAKLHRCYGLCRAVLVEAEMEEDDEIFLKVLVLTTTMIWMTRKAKTMKTTTKPTILPQKQALLRKRKERFRPFDSCVLKLMDIFLISLQCVFPKFLLLVVVITFFGCYSLLLLSASDVVSVQVSSTEVLRMLFIVVIGCFGCCISYSFIK